jgi:hypothetical protein
LAFHGEDVGHFLVFLSKEPRLADEEESHAEVRERKAMDDSGQLREAGFNVRALDIHFSDGLLEEHDCSKNKGKEDSVAAGPLS